MRTFVQQQNRRHGHGFPSSKSQTTIAKSALPNIFQDHQSFDKANRFGFDFSRIPLYPSAPSSAQAKLTIGSLSDSCEQEAYRFSEQVGSVAEPYLQPKNSRGTNYFEEHKQKREPAVADEFDRVEIPGRSRCPVCCRRSTAFFGSSNRL